VNIEKSESTGDTEREFPRGKQIATVVIAVFAVVGFVIAPFIAPGLPWWRSGLGGALLGAFAGAAAVLNRILE
jgi:hypothetical protein